MHNEHRDALNHSDRNRALFAGEYILNRYGQWVVKHALCGLKAQPVLTPICAFFRGIPRPAHCTAMAVTT